MHLREVPDDWLRDILIFHDFRTRWRLRRCCRKWKTLMLSDSINHTIILEGEYGRTTRERSRHWKESRYNQFQSAIGAVTSRIFCILGRGPIQSSNYTSVVQTGYACLTRFSDGDRSFEVIFHNVPDLCMFMVSQSCSRRHVTGVLLVNVKVDLDEFWSGIDRNLVCISHNHYLCPYAKHLARRHRNQHVSVPYYHHQGETPSGLLKWSNSQNFWSTLFFAILPPLKADRLQTLQSYNYDNNESLRKPVEKIFRALPYAWGLPANLLAGPIDFSKLPKLVTWLAFSEYNNQQANRTPVDSV